MIPKYLMSLVFFLFFWLVHLLQLPVNANNTKLKDLPSDNSLLHEIPMSFRVLSCTWITMIDVLQLHKVDQRDSYLCPLTANNSTSLIHLTLLKLVNTKGEICPWPWYASCPSSMYSSEIQSELWKTQHYYVSHLCQGTHSVMREPTQIECDSLVLMKQPPFPHVCSSTQLHRNT